MLNLPISHVWLGPVIIDGAPVYGFKPLRAYQSEIHARSQIYSF